MKVHLGTNRPYHDHILPVLHLSQAGRDGGTETALDQVTGMRFADLLGNGKTDMNTASLCTQECEGRVGYTFSTAVNELKLLVLP